MKHSNIKAQLLILMAAVLWGTNGTAQAFSPEAANPMTIAALRTAIGGTLLFSISALRGSFKEISAISKKNVFMASVSIAFYQVFFFMGVSKTGVALGTILAIGSAPVFSGIIEFFQGIRQNKQWVLATGISIAGCVMLFSGQDNIVFDPYGAVLCLGAGLSYAFYVSVSQSLISKWPRDAVNGLIIFSSAIILSPILFLNDLSWLMSAEGLIPVLHLGVLATALAYTLFTCGLPHVTVSKAVALTLAEPVTASLLGIIVLKECVTYISLIGIILIFTGLAFNVISKSNKSEI
ncbi:MAG: EamA family transporter [Clostridiales bacterium]|nr:EamA family transporter [Clostridiales bacterium]